MSGQLLIWTIYDHPRDYPHAFVVRRSVIDGPVPKADMQPWALTHTLDAARESLPPGLTCMPRQAGDDPVIVECWI